jgi:hypothetical protein
MVGVCREMAEAVEVEQANCYQGRGEGKWVMLGNRETMVLETDE